MTETEWQKQQAEREREELKKFKKEKKAHCKKLKAAGIVKVSGEYQGSGDSGNMGDIVAYKLKENYLIDQGGALEGEELQEWIANASKGVDDDALEVAQDTATRHLMKDLDDFLFSAAYGAHPGFENNEGGHGVVTLFVEEERVLVEHWDYIQTEEQAEDVTL